jgi:three-Cys-motif partner protein
VMTEGPDRPRSVPPDGLYTPTIKRHSLEKITLHNRYANIFAAGMHRRWPQLAYVGLYAGAGRAQIHGTSEIVETSALAVMRQPVPFTDYIYVDKNPECTNALRARIEAIGPSGKVTIIEDDVNGSAERVCAALPAYGPGNGLLSFCFVDPFDLQLQFATIRKLAHLRMDFLVLLMLGVDGRRNIHRYVSDQTSTRIGDLIDCPEWRAEYQNSGRVVRFLLTKFDGAMQGLGYLSAAGDFHDINVHGMGVFQYALAFYSKDEVGRKFWRQSKSSLSTQLGLAL